MTTYTLYTEDGRAVHIWDGTYLEPQFDDIDKLTQLDPEVRVFDAEACGERLKVYLDMLVEHDLIEESFPL